MNHSDIMGFYPMEYVDEMPENPEPKKMYMTYEKQCTDTGCSHVFNFSMSFKMKWLRKRTFRSEIKRKILRILNHNKYS